MRSSRGLLGIWMGLVSVALIVSLAGAAYGQVAAGEITGTITDAKGAAMAGVTVTVHSEDTGIDTAIKSNDSGVYTAPLLQPGTYDVTGTQTGFATIQNKGIVVQVGATLRIDMQMPVASQQSLVTVTTEAPLLETETTEQAQTVSESMVSDLPLASRRWEQVTMLTPTVATDGTGGMAFHGINSMFNSNSVDGSSNDNDFAASARGSAPFGSTTDGYVFSPDSVKEFQVSSSNFSAELGHAAGGAVNAVTKAGTNSIHGDLFENLRNPDLNALDPVIKAADAQVGQTPTQSVHQQNQFGGSVGGPLLKDKLFYFITYDGYRKSTPIAFTTSNPVGPLPCPTEISALQCSAAKNYINVENLGTFPRLLRQDVALGKLDYQITPANHVNAVFDWRNWQEPLSQSFASSTNSGLTTGTESLIQDRSIVSTWDTVIGSNKVNEVRYLYSSDHIYTESNPNQQLPSVSLSNLFGYGTNQVVPGWNPVEDRHEISDTFSFTKGQHSFKAGVDLNFVHDNIRSTTPSSGSYSYTGAVTGSLSTTAFAAATGCTNSTTGLIFCDWLLDLYGVNVGDGRTGTHWTTFGQARDFTQPGNLGGQFVPVFFDIFESYQTSGFFEDTWKARHNLTVELGLRYDVQLLPYSPNPYPNTDDAFTASYSTSINTDLSGLQPRLGVAWSVSKNTVVRVGLGTFWAKVPLSGVSASRRLAGGHERTFNCSPAQAVTVGNVCDGLVFPDVLYSQAALAPAAPFSISGAPATQQPLTPGVLDPPGNPCIGTRSCTYDGMDPNLKNPRVYEGEVALERQIPGNMTVSASYVVTRGERLPNYWDTNLAPTSTTKTYDVVNSSGVTQLTSTVPFFLTPVDPTSGGMLTEFSNVNSWYNALVLTLHKPMSHGLELQVNYTFSRSTDTGESTSNVGGEGNDSGEGVLNPYDQKLENGVSSLNIPNRFTTSVVWAPQYAKDFKNKTAKGVLDNWTLSSSITASQGTTYSAADQSSAQPCLTAASSCPTADVGVDGGMTGALLSTSRGPTGGRIAWLPRDSFALPNYANVDMRLAKEFVFRERYHFGFRVDAFNLFNSTIVQAVNTTAFNPVQPSATSTTCPSATHTNTCMVPVSTFQQATTTSAFLLGARQLQFGLRFDF